MAKTERREEVMLQSVNDLTQRRSGRRESNENQFRHSSILSAPLRLCVRLFLVVILLAGSSQRSRDSSQSHRDVASQGLRIPLEPASRRRRLAQRAIRRPALRPGAHAVRAAHAARKCPNRSARGRQDGVERALEFIRKHVDENGALGHADPDIVEYPVYSTAYATALPGAVQSIARERRNRSPTATWSVFLEPAQFR